MRKERAAHITAELNGTLVVGKSKFRVRMDEGVKTALVRTLSKLDATTSDFITRLKYHKLDQAAAKEVRRLAGIEKRKGKHKSLDEIIKIQMKDIGDYWRRSIEGMKEQKQYDRENNIKRPKGFYDTKRKKAYYDR